MEENLIPDLDNLPIHLFQDNKQKQSPVRKS